MTEKLLTLKETAECLGLSEEKVRSLVEKGEIPAYQIGGTYLRFKEEQILSLKPRYSKRVSAPVFAKAEKENLPGEEPLISKIQDFFYFNNFYIISGLLIAALVYIIIKSVR